MLFEERGYYGTSLRMIAREASITPSLLQKYFTTKDDLLAAFVERALDEIDEFTTATQKAIATTTGAEPLLRAIGLRYFSFLNRMRGFYLTWIMCPEAVAPYRDSLPEFVTLNHRIIANALQQRLGIGADDAFTRTQIFFSSIFAWVMYYARVASRKSPSESPSVRIARLITHVICDDTSSTKPELTATP